MAHGRVIIPADTAAASRPREDASHPARSRPRSGRRAQRRRSCPGAEDVSIGNVEIVSRNRDVVVILDRKSNGIGKAKVDLAILDQVIQPRRIRKTGEGYCCPPI